MARPGGPAGGGSSPGRGRPGRAGQLARGWASSLEEGGIGEGGAAGGDRGLFSQLAFAFKYLESTYVFTEASQGSLLLLYFNK